MRPSAFLVLQCILLSVLALEKRDPPARHRGVNVKSQSSENFNIIWGPELDVEHEADELLDNLEKQWPQFASKLGYKVNPEKFTQSGMAKYKMNAYIAQSGLKVPNDESSTMWMYNPADKSEGVYMVAYPTVNMFTYEQAQIAQWMSGGVDVFNESVHWFTTADAERLVHYFHPEYLSSWDPCGKLQLDNHFVAWSTRSSNYGAWLFIQYLSEKHGDDFVGRVISSCPPAEDPLQHAALMLRTTPADIFADFVRAAVTWDFKSLNIKEDCPKAVGDNGHEWSRLTDVKKEEDVYRPKDKRLQWLAFEVVDLEHLLPDGHRSDDPACNTISFKVDPFPEDWRIVHIATDHERAAKEVKTAKGSDNSIVICNADHIHQNLLAFVAGAIHGNRTMPTFEFQIKPGGTPRAPPPAPSSSSTPSTTTTQPVSLTQPTTTTSSTPISSTPISSILSMESITPGQVISSTITSSQPFTSLAPGAMPAAAVGLSRSTVTVTATMVNTSSTVTMIGTSVNASSTVTVTATSTNTSAIVTLTETSVNASSTITLTATPSKSSAPSTASPKVMCRLVVEKETEE